MRSCLALPLSQYFEIASAFAWNAPLRVKGWTGEPAVLKNGFWRGGPWESRNYKRRPLRRS
jgi:hypothetical protein